MDVLSSGAINEKFQVHLSLTEETASVDEVQKMYKEQLGFDVILLDAKHLPGKNSPQVIFFPLYNEQDLCSGEGAERYWWPRKVV